MCGVYYFEDIDLNFVVQKYMARGSCLAAVHPRRAFGKCDIINSKFDMKQLAK